MSRENKYRAWDKNDLRMIVHEQDFIPLKVCSLGVLRLSAHHKEDRWQIIDADRFELMRFTGFKTKDGAEVYDGDFVGGGIHGTVQVAFDEEWGAWVSLSYENEYDEEGVLFRRENRELFSNDLKDCFDDWRVIGNIHTHPELLKQ